MLFTLPARSLDDIRDAMARGPVEVVAYDQDNRRALATGKLLLVDNIIDQATATIKLKAIFANDDEKLWPGEFVNAHVLLDTRSDAVVVPYGAVQRGPNGLFVWTVTANNLAEPRPIEVGPAYQDLTVVTSGLNDGERIVTDGQYKLQRNAPVAVSAHQPAAVAGEQLVNISEPFIRRPIATTLLMTALAFVGIVAFPFLPVAPLPQVDFPTIQVTANLAGRQRRDHGHRRSPPRSSGSSRRSRASPR